VPEKIASLDQLRQASAGVEVGAIEFTVPATPTDAETALSGRYFNKPLDERFSGVTTAEWQKKWDLMATVLIGKAKTARLDSESLESCLATLNYGRTDETKDGVGFSDPLIDRDTTPEEAEKLKREAQAKYDAAVKWAAEHPEELHCRDAAIPVGAFLARHARGSCWIIVCKWEVPGPENSMGHIRVWALDTVTHKTIAYVTCD
jgi:uncharacterized protein YfaA (DUF2138 family)